MHLGSLAFAALAALASTSMATPVFGQNNYASLDTYYTKESRLDLTGITKGSQCTNPSDFNDNWQSETRPNGFDNFPVDLKVCTTTCLSDKGGIPLVECVGQCMAGKFSDIPLEGKAYSETCSGCMGELAQCTSNNCFSCAASVFDGKYSVTCLGCNERNCSPAFYGCAGIDTTINIYYAPLPLLDEVGIIIVSVGCATAVIVAIVSLYLLSNRNSAADTVLMIQQALGDAPVPPSPWRGETAKRLLHREKKKKLRKKNDPSYDPNTSQVTESSLGADTFTTSSFNPEEGTMFFDGVVLTVVWDFEAQMEDELTVEAGEEVTGIKPVEEWWLVQNIDGVCGLIPESYVLTDKQKHDVLSGTSGMRSVTSKNNMRMNPQLL